MDGDFFLDLLKVWSNLVLELIFVLTFPAHVAKVDLSAKQGGDQFL